MSQIFYSRLSLNFMTKNGKLFAFLSKLHFLEYIKFDLGLKKIILDSSFHNTVENDQRNS